MTFVPEFPSLWVREESECTLGKGTLLPPVAFWPTEVVHTSNPRSGRR